MRLGVLSVVQDCHDNASGLDRYKLGFCMLKKKNKKKTTPKPHDSVATTLALFC